MQCLHVNLKIIFLKISGFKLFYEKNDFLAPKIVSFIFVIFVFCEIYLYVSITFCICMLIEKIYFFDCLIILGSNCFVKKMISWHPKLYLLLLLFLFYEIYLHDSITFCICMLHNFFVLIILGSICFVKK